MRCPGPLLPAHWFALALAAAAAATCRYWETLGLNFLLTVLMMRFHAESAGAQTAYCFSLLKTTMIRRTEVQNLAVFHGAMYAAIRAMQTNPEDFRVQVSCAKALERLVDGNQPLALKAVRDGALDAVVTALQDWPDKAGLQTMCTALATLGSTAPELWPLVVKAEGINLIFKGMSRTFGNVGAIREMNIAIIRLSEDEAMAEELAREPRVAFLVKLMRHHASSSAVAEVIMLAFKNMLRYGQQRHRGVLVRQGLPETSLAVLRGHLNHSIIAFAVGSQLAMLAHRSKETQDFLLEQGAVELLFEAVAQHSTPQANERGPVVPSAFQAWWCLARGNAAVQARLVEVGAVKRFTELIGVFSGDVRLLGTACAALATLTEGNETNLAAAASVPTWCQPHLRGQSSAVNLTELEGLLGFF